MEPSGSRPSRRRFLFALAGVGAAGIAGCLGTADDGSVEPGEVDPDDVGWPSYNADAGNTGYAPDTAAPLRGVEERWRVDIGTPTAPPVVVNDTLYYQHYDRLLALDTDTGERRWTVEQEHSTYVAPTVADGAVFVGEAMRARALEAESGEELWRTDLVTARSSAPTFEQEEGVLYVGCGEHVFRLDAETGEIEWQRDVFGEASNPIALYREHPVVTTEAGEIYHFTAGGEAQWRYRAPSLSVSPPTVNERTTLVGSVDGVIAIDTSLGRVRWSADVGPAHWGLAATPRTVYVKGGREFYALNATNGDELWRTSLEAADRLVPAVIGDTVYVGGPRLHAFEPGGGVGIAGVRFGEARFTADLGGPVGQWIAGGGGRLYLTVRTGEDDEHALLALDDAEGGA